VFVPSLVGYDLLRCENAIFVELHFYLILNSHYVPFATGHDNEIKKMLDSKLLKSELCFVLV